MDAHPEVTRPLSVFALVMLLLLIHEGGSQTHDDVERLLSYLTNSSRYNPDIRPVRTMSTPTVINITMGIFWLDSFDLRTGKVALTGYMLVSWVDEYLTWDPSLYGGLGKVALPDGHFWVPKIFNIKSEGSVTDSKMSATSVVADGRLFYVTGGNYETTCATDIYNMPFDAHFCVVQMMPAGYEQNELTVHHTDVYKDNFVEDQEWHFENLSATAINSTIALFSVNEVQFTFTLRRRPAHMLMHAVLPYVLTVGLNIVACFVPVDSGERMSFSLTLFLSFVFVVSSITGSIPPDSKNISLFSIFTTIFHALNTFSVAWSVIVTNVAAFPDNNRIPLILKYLCIKMLQLNSNNRIAAQTDDVGNEHKLDLQKNATPNGHSIALIDGDISSGKVKLDPDGGKDADVFNKPNANTDGTAVTWKLVSQTLDKIYFYIYLIVYSVSIILFITLAVIY